MPRVSAEQILRSRHTTLFAGAVMAVCFAAIATLPTLRGAPLTRFLTFYLIAGAAYWLAVLHLGQNSLSYKGIWAFALLFRLAMLFATPPTLSDDVYRYMWDGRLMNAGINPYAHTVDSLLLDDFDSPQRALVNNAWMASPYLPVAQTFFSAVYRVIPDSPFGFQAAALLLDLVTGVLIADTLGRLVVPRERVLIYLWNPLVVVEFAHGAHMDALMLALMMVALRALVAERNPAGTCSTSPGRPSCFRHAASLGRWLLPPLALAAATLTKFIPSLLTPVVMWRWGRRRTLLYIGLVGAALLPFALGAGWGLTGPRDGEGVLGALRIYAARWNYNGGLYHWLEVGLSGYATPGAVPPEIVGEAPIRIAKLTMAIILGLVLTFSAWKARRCRDDLGLLRLATVPLGAYLLLTTTVHPWYVTVIIPLLPFLLARKGETTSSGRFVWPWVFLSVTVTFSYLTYLDPANLREYDGIRLAEYVPVYLLLIWAAWPAIGGVLGPESD